MSFGSVPWAAAFSARLVASQGPEFSQQYRQRLGGGIDELRQVVGRFDADARAHGETRRCAIARLRANPDDSRAGKAPRWRVICDRLAQARSAPAADDRCGPVRARCIDGSRRRRGHHERRLRRFEPAVPVTQEGCSATAFGFVCFGVRFCCSLASFAASSVAVRLRPVEPDQGLAGFPESPRENPSPS